MYQGAFTGCGEGAFVSGHRFTRCRKWPVEKWPLLGAGVGFLPCPQPLWARRKAAEENTSVSRLLSDLLEREMRLSDAYWRAFEHWKSHRPTGAAGATQRMSRDEVHERR